MKYWTLLFLALLLLNCEDKKTDKKSVIPPVTQTEAPKSTEKKDSILTPEREFPKLNSKNAMDFFLEYEKHHKENKVRIVTDMGNIEIELFEKTKFHRANFIFLAKQKYFDNTQFYRVINNFMIQGGNSDTRTTARKRSHIGRYLLPPDTKRGLNMIAVL